MGGNEMKKCFYILISILLSGCSHSENVQAIEQSDFYSFYDVIDVKDVKKVELMTSDVIIDVHQSEQDSLLELLERCIFVEDDSTKTTPHGFIRLFNNRQNDLFYFDVSFNDSLVLRTIHDGKALRTIELDEELSIAIGEEMAKAGIMLFSYEEIANIESYKIYSLKSKSYRGYSLKDYNQELYIPVKEFPAKYQEVTLSTGEVFYELIQRGYIEYLTTNLKYPTLPYYIGYEEEILHVSRWNEIPFDVLNKALTLMENDFYLHHIKLE